MIDKVLKIFFSGIGGSGVSAIAGFVAEKGHIIAGSDRLFDKNPDNPLKKVLQSKGIHIVPQDGSGIDRTINLAVFSTAVEHDQPEFIKASSLGIPIKTRPEFLSELSASFKTIAVSGTSGKSTVSGLLAFLMRELGLNPNFIGGGRVKQFRSSVNQGNYLAGDSQHLIIEACESDGTIVHYKPEHSIILNLSLDHHTIDKTAAMFHELIKNTAGKVILNADDENLAMVAVGDAVTFSIEKPSAFRAYDILYMPFSTDFALRKIRFTLSLPGRHNLLNALSCIALLSEFRIPLEQIANVLPEFKGIERRFDIYLNNEHNLVIDDYAHNPHKIYSLMQTVNKIRENICYIFQPHGFAPTIMMKDEYIDVFADNLRGSDHLILLPIFYAGGTVRKDISSYDLADGIKAKRGSVEVVNEREDIIKRVHEHKNYVIFGARDETLADFVRDIADSLKML
jgi:UDP-N-acetylmuramate--alanine ligase